MPDEEDLDPQEEGAEVHPYNLETWMGDNERLLGFCGTLKYLDAEGEVTVFHVNINMPAAEAIGHHLVAQQGLMDEVTLAMYETED